MSWALEAIERAAMQRAHNEITQYPVVPTLMGLKTVYFICLRSWFEREVQLHLNDLTIDQLQDMLKTMTIVPREP